MYSPNKQVGIVDPALATQPQPAQQIPQAVQQPVQQNQITPSPINPNVLGGFDPQKLTGVPNPTQSFNNTMPQVGVSAPLQQHHDKKEKVLVTGNTKSEQIVANNIETKKQVNFAKEYNNYKTARENKKNWEDKENDFGFGDKKYPQQKQLDSLRTVYKNLK